jgi:transcriptional regulator with XRE-family HTH domain
VRAARLEAGKSQTDVAESLGLTFQQVQKYERARTAFPRASSMNSRACSIGRCSSSSTGWTVP